MDQDLDLDKAVNAVRQREAVRKQQAILRGPNTEDGTICDIKGASRRGQPRQKPGNGKPQSGPFRTQNAQGGPSRSHSRLGNAQGVSSRQRGASVCIRCGKSPSHGRLQCPAKDAFCHHCSKKGHFKSMCRSRSTIGDISELENEIAFLDTVESDVATVKGEGQPWMISLYLNNCQREFKIDTGADVTVIPENTYEKSRDGPLSPPGRVRRGPGQHALPV